MTPRILAACSPGEARVVVLCGGALRDYAIWRPGAPDGVGDLSRGRVTARVAALGGSFVALDEALSGLAEIEPVKAELVKLRFFTGLTMPEAAAALNISLATAERHWTFAKAWLYAEMADDA